MTATAKKTSEREHRSRREDRPSRAACRDGEAAHVATRFDVVRCRRRHRDGLARAGAGRRFSSRKARPTVANITARKMTIGIVFERAWKILAPRGRMHLLDDHAVRVRDVVGPLLLRADTSRTRSRPASESFIAPRGDVDDRHDVDQRQRVCGLPHDDRRGDDLARGSARRGASAGARGRSWRARRTGSSGC